MSVQSWVRKLFFRKPLRPIARRRRLEIEWLEDRAVPAVLAVNGSVDNIDADDVLTFREAVRLINAGGDAQVALGRALTAAEAAQVNTSTPFGTADTITFASNVTGTIQLMSEMALTRSLDIQGPGAGSLTVRGNTGFRVFNVSGPNTAALISGLTITNGRPSSVGGGGILVNSGTSVTVTSAVLFGNFPSSGTGGAALVNGGTLNLVNTTVSSNSALSGGGIRVNSVFDGPVGRLTVTGSTFHSNQATSTATGNGGAIFVNERSEAVITNSTFASQGTNYVNGTNIAAVGGGAIFTAATATTTVINSTIAGNRSVNADGGGVRVAEGGTLVLNNTIVAGNMRGPLNGPYITNDIGGGVGTGSSNNLVVGSGTGGLTDGVNGNRVVTIASSDIASARAAAGLATMLANNGGPTQMIALVAGSPAIGAGPFAAAGATIDQRGYGRPASGNIDLGAYQSTAVPREAASLVVTTTDDVVNPFDGVTSFREAVALANATPGADTITFAPNLAGATIALTEDSLRLTDPSMTTIDGGVAGVTISGFGPVGGSSGSSGGGDAKTDDGKGGTPGFMAPAFAVDEGASAALTRLTITGAANGLENHGKIELTGVTVAGHSAGGIRNLAGGVLSLTNVTIAGNGGEGLYNSPGAEASVAFVTIAGNTIDIADGATGAGVYNAGTLTGTNVLIVGNQVAGKVANGGGLFNQGAASFRNLIVSGNRAFNDGGGIWTAEYGSLTLVNAVVAGNTAVADADLSGVLAAGSSSNQIGGSIGPVVVTDADGKPLLADNGGPTQTIALAVGSPAFAAGIAVNGVTADQRGFARNATPDIGAFETQVPTVQVIASDRTYNGSPIGATSATVTGLNGTVLAAFGGADPVNTGAITFEYFDLRFGSTNPISLGSTPPTDQGDYLVIARFTSNVTGYRDASSAPATYTIQPASTVVALDISSTRPLLGTDGLTLTATVSILGGGGTPTGTVKFEARAPSDDDDRIDLGTITLGPDGKAVLTLSAAQIAALLPAGGYTIQASYSPTENFRSRGTTASISTVAPATIQGMVYTDLNNDGEVDFGEQGIAGVKITLTGTNDLGQAVNLTAFTDADGIYQFTNLRPGTYTVTQTQPAGWLDGIDTLGTINGVNVGTAGNDVFTGIVLGAGQVAENYNFGERPAIGSPVGWGDTAGIGFWQNKNGQKLITSLNGGANSTVLGNWLATNFPNLYGSLAGTTNAQVAAFYKTLFSLNGKTAPGGPPKTDAQVMATALAVYVSNQSLAGTTALSYGFNVSAGGTGAKTFNVGKKGAAFGVANDSNVSVMDLLLAVNARSKNGLLFDVDGNGSLSSSEVSLRTIANDVFSAINELGGK